MNNKGQALVFTVILIPIIITILLTVIEGATVAYQKTKITSNIKSIITTCYNKCSDEQIKELLNKNDIKYEKINIKKDSYLTINIDVKIDSMIGNIVNKEFYLLNIDLSGRIENKKLVIKKG